MGNLFKRNKFIITSNINKNSNNKDMLTFKPSPLVTQSFFHPISNSLNVSTEVPLSKIQRNSNNIRLLKKRSNVLSTNMKQTIHTTSPHNDNKISIIRKPETK